MLFLELSYIIYKWASISSSFVALLRMGWCANEIDDFWEQSTLTLRFILIKEAYIQNTYISLK